MYALPLAELRHICAIGFPANVERADIGEKPETRSYCVFVVELEPALCEHGGCPSPVGCPPVHAGQSIHPPEIRFQQHRQGRGPRSTCGNTTFVSVDDHSRSRWHRNERRGSLDAQSESSSGHARCDPCASANGPQSAPRVTSVVLDARRECLDRAESSPEVARCGPRFRSF